MTPENEPCECELPGYFYSGVPGILARVEQGRLAAGANVERCDLCRRYSDDHAAYRRLVELGMAPTDEPPSPHESQETPS